MLLAEPATAVTSQAGPSRNGTGFAQCEGAQTWSTRLDTDEATSEAFHGSGEVIAALHATHVIPLDAPIHFISAALVLLNVLFKNRQDWEDKDWQGVVGAPYMRALVNRLRQRCAPTTFGPGTATQREQLREVLRRARDATLNESTTTVVTPKRNPVFDLIGAKLSTLTQAQAYRYIRGRAQRTGRLATGRIMTEVLRGM